MLCEEMNDEFYQLCTRYKPYKYDRNPNNFLIIPITDEDIAFAKAFLSNPETNVNKLILGKTYFHYAVSNRHYELAELIVFNERFDFENLKLEYIFGTTVLFVLDEQPDLLLRIMKDPRFDGEILNMKSNDVNGNETILHQVCQHHYNYDVFRTIIENNKFRCLNDADSYGVTALYHVIGKDFQAVKLITSHRDFDVSTIVKPTTDDVYDGVTPLSSCGDHETFVHLLDLLETSNLVANPAVQKQIFKDDSMGYNILKSMSRSDKSYTSLCYLIKFIERNNMRELVMPKLSDITLVYPGKKVFNLIKEYRTKPDETIEKLNNGTYDHDYEPSYFSKDLFFHAMANAFKYHVFGIHP